MVELELEKKGRALRRSHAEMFIPSQQCLQDIQAVCCLSGSNNINNANRRAAKSDSKMRYSKRAVHHRV